MNVSAYSQRKESIIKQLLSVEGWGNSFAIQIVYFTMFLFKY